MEQESRNGLVVIKKLTCKVTVKDMPSKITKGISVSYKKVKNYVVATYKNTLAYPVLIYGGIVQYDKDGKKIENFGMQNTASIRVSAKSSVKFYIMLADNCSYYEKEKISGQVDVYENDMYITADAKTISLSDVVAENSRVYWRENKLSPFEYDYDAQILSFDEEGNLLGTVHCVTSTDFAYDITEDGMRYTIGSSDAELVEAADKVQTNVYECTIKVQNND